MSMPPWLIPSGEILFTGSEKQLHAVIGALNGKLRGDRSFTCRLGGGAASFRFKMETVFRCAYAGSSEGLRITWLLFAALALVSLAGLLCGGWELAGWMLCLLTFLVFLYAIQWGNCIEQFREQFSK